MLLRFLVDFRSMHTGENFYAAGAKADFDSEHARALIAEGVAEAVPLAVREGQAVSAEAQSAERKAPEALPAPAAPTPPTPPRKPVRRG
jgi:hypothetical protein